MIEVSRITDIDTLILWRKKVIEAVFGLEPNAELLENTRAYYEKYAGTENHVAILLGEPECGMGCGALCISDELPSPDNPSGKCGYLMNIYVRKDFRGQGLGHWIVGWLTSYAHQAGCGKIYLESTDGAHSIYTDLGYKDMPHMMKYEKD